MGSFRKSNTVISADVTVAGATPRITVGDAGEEDTMIVFDGNAVDYRMGVDDGTDSLEFGLGAAHGTNTAMAFANNGTTTFSFNTVNEGRIVEHLEVVDEADADATLLVAEMKKGIILHTTATTARTTTTDTAANIIAGIPLTANNQCVKVHYINDGTHDVIFAGGTGVTIADTAQRCPTDGGVLLIFQRTGASAVKMFCIGGAPDEGD